MIEGGWAFIWASYAVTVAGLGVAAIVVALRLRHWARAARALNEAKPEKRA